ncbi:hypothetical protein BSKO_02532 [Bryopsis sp. KO-2023]|nr:hypothetical protein BSKO_02532 [Bryopsis sp. KO-2023]
MRYHKSFFSVDMTGDFTVLAKQWGLQEIPQALLEKKKAKVIVLSRNSLTTIPPEIGGLISLTVLKLDQNRIRILPDEIGNLHAPTELSLADNLLNNLPVALGAITGLKKLVLNGNPMMEEVPGSKKKLWEIWYGPNAGPCPAKEIQCLQRPAATSGTLKMRTSFVMASLKRANTEKSETCTSRDLSTEGGWTRASRETEDALSARVRHPGGKSAAVSPAGSSISRAKHGSILVAAEEPPSATPASPSTLNDHDERNRRRFWTRCSLIGGAVIGVAAVALWRRRQKSMDWGMG